MKKEFLTAFVAICALALGACAPATETGDAGAAGEMAAEEEAAAPQSTVQSELLADLGTLREKYVGLAEAMPESAYGWRPAEGVRSVSEVYMHVASANFGLVSRVAGTTPPEEAAAWYGQDAESITDKATVVQAVGASFDFVAEAIAATGDDRWPEGIELFGATSVRGAMTFTLAHCHEHLGQSIAYARMNGVVPPWST